MFSVVQNQLRDDIMALQDVLSYVTASLNSVQYVDPAPDASKNINFPRLFEERINFVLIPLQRVNKKELCICNWTVFHFTYSYPILPHNNTSPILLWIRNTRFSVLCSRKSRMPDHVTGSLCAGLRNGNHVYVSLTLEGSCLQKTAVQSTCRPTYGVSSKCTGLPPRDVRQRYYAAPPMAWYECVISSKVYILKSAVQVVRSSPWQQKHTLDKPLENHGLFFSGKCIPE